MSKITPCLWFKDEAVETVNFYVSLLPDSRFDHVQRNVGDGLAGKDGAVLVIDFTPGRRSFMALNGGMKFQYADAISLAVDCLD